MLSPMRPASKQPVIEASVEGDEAADEAATGKWRGHLGSLFSPMLRIFGESGDEATADGAAISEEQQRRIAEQARLAQEEAERAAAEEQRRREAQAAAAAEAAAAEDEEDEDDVDEFNPYLFIKQLPPYAEALNGAIVHPRLPPRRMTRSDHKPVTLVLDLDETLVHCSVEPTAAADLVFPVHFNGVEYQVHVSKRPYLKTFLERVAAKFEVVVFTASQKVYADKLLDIIDPKKELIKHRLFRDSCLLVEGNYLKDLNVLGRDLTKAVLVDNSPHAFGYQVDNGIPIESWFDDPADTELLKLADFLDTIQSAEDVRPLVRNHFKTHELIAKAQDR